VSFFEPPEPPEHARELLEQPAPKPWFGAPSNELGVGVPLSLLLARTETVAVAIVGATAFSTGIQLRFATRRRPQLRTVDEGFDFFDDDPFEGHPFGRFRQRMRGRGELPDELLRFGVQFSDGRKATTVGGFPWVDAEDAEKAPAGPVLVQGGGGGGSSGWEFDFWLWPVPPPGQLTFAVEWPAHGIGLTQHHVEATPLIKASTKSEPLWPESVEGGTVSTGQFRLGE